MESSDEQLNFLKECEEEFQNRYTDADEDFFKVKCSTLTNPPILDPWPYKTQRSKHRSQRYSADRRSHSQRRDYDRSNGRRNGDRERYRDGRRKRQKRQDRNDRERNRERSADRRERDRGRAEGRKRHQDRRSEERSRKRSGHQSHGNSHRDEERDRRHRRENKNRDNYYRGKERSRDRQRHRDFDNYEHKVTKKAAEKNEYATTSAEIPETYQRWNYQHNEQDVWNTYVSRHNLYENYRPYF